MGEQSFGEAHYNVGVILAALAHACGEAGNLQRKRELLEQSLPIMERHLGATHANVAVYLLEIASTCAKLGDTEREEEMYIRAKEIQEGMAPVREVVSSSEALPGQSIIMPDIPLRGLVQRVLRQTALDLLR